MRKSGVIEHANSFANIHRKRAAAPAALLIGAAVAAIMAGASPAARAQTQPAGAQPAGEDQIAEVMITGSRVIREGMSSPTPVTAISADELLATHPQALVEGLAQLPALSSSTTPKSIGGSTSAGAGSFLNLRNLGPTRNLVLLDGRRVTPTNLAGNVDINTLPQSLISNVSIVTGGASAAYGSDAVAGVTNFILNTRFTGLKVDAGTGSSSRGDAGYYKTSVAWGAPFMDDRLHVIASFDWRHSQPGYASKRDWANDHCVLIPLPGVTTVNQSATNPRQTIACNVSQPNGAYGGVINTGPLTTASQGVSFGPGGIAQPFIYGTQRTTNFQVGGTGDPAFDADAVNFLTPVNAKVGFTHLTYDITSNVEAFAQFTGSNSASAYPQTPANFNATRPLTIFSGNPFIPASLQARMTALNVPSFVLNIVPKSWGSIEADSNYRTYDSLAGLKGKFGDGWSWDAHYEHGRSHWSLVMPNQVSEANLFRAADAVVAPNGTIVCQSAIANPGAYGGCVPINVLGAGSASPQALNYIHGSLLNDNVMTQDDGTASINGEPFKLWAGPLSFATGVEWRRLKGTATSDPTSQNFIDFTGVRGVPSALVSQSGGWMSNNPKPTQGSYTVKEAFAEVLVPLAKDLPALQALDLNGAIRVTDYSQSGTVETWKAGLVWRPITDLLFRATQSRDIRAPGIADLYAGDATNPVTVTDPFKGGASFSIRQATSGNPNLVPERANTFTVGATYESSWLRGFGFSVDYYNIKIADVLAGVQSQEEINRCFQGQTEFCSLLLRDPTGNLFLIRTPTLNLNQARTKGVDFEISYRNSLFLGGAFSARLIATRLMEQSTTVSTPTGPQYSDRAGDIGAGNPKWRVNAITSYEVGPVGIDVTGRYIGSGVFNATFVPGDIDPRFANLPSNFTLDFGLRYKLPFKGEPQLYFNVENVLDKDPPLIPGTALTSFETNSSLYDTLGRFFSAGIRAQF